LKTPVIARSEATKQSILARKQLDCFASLAMTAVFALCCLSASPPPYTPTKIPRPPLLDFLAAFGDAVAAVVAVDVLERLAAVANAAMPRRTYSF
jgi:hypothetical protein